VLIGNHDLSAGKTDRFEKVPWQVLNRNVTGFLRDFSSLSPKMTVSQWRVPHFRCLLRKSMGDHDLSAEKADFFEKVP
jgi:hypothetical protein